VEDRLRAWSVARNLTGLARLGSDGAAPATNGGAGVDANAVAHAGVGTLALLLLHVGDVDVAARDGGAAPHVDRGERVAVVERALLTGFALAGGRVAPGAGRARVARVAAG